MKQTVLNTAHLFINVRMCVNHSSKHFYSSKTNYTLSVCLKKRCMFLHPFHSTKLFTGVEDENAATEIKKLKSMTRNAADRILLYVLFDMLSLSCIPTVY